jgi:hypothetical protein
MVNGNLLLTISDLVLPGNAAMDLHLLPSFTNKRVQADSGRSAGWGSHEDHQRGCPSTDGRLGQGNADAPDGGRVDGKYDPVLEQHGHRRLDNRAFWRYTLAARKVEMLNDWTATYSQDKGAARSSTTIQCTLQAIRDRFSAVNHAILERDGLCPTNAVDMAHYQLGRRRTGLGSSKSDCCPFYRLSSGTSVRQPEAHVSASFVEALCTS